MNNIEKVCNILGLKLYEEFTVKASDYGKILGYKVDDKVVYRFSTQLLHKGIHNPQENDDWYGGGGEEKILYYLLLGLYEINERKCL